MLLIFSAVLFQESKVNRLERMVKKTLQEREVHVILLNLANIFNWISNSDSTLP